MQDQFDLEPPSTAHSFLELDKFGSLVSELLVRKAVALTKLPYGKPRRDDAFDIVGDAFVKLVERQGGWHEFLDNLLIDLEYAKQPLTLRRLCSTIDERLAPEVLRIAGNVRRCGDVKRVTLASDMSVNFEETYSARDLFDAAEWQMELDRVIELVRKTPNGGLILVSVGLSSERDEVEYAQIDDSRQSDRLYKAKRSFWQRFGKIYENELHFIRE